MIYLILMALVSIFVCILALQNTAAVEVGLFSYTCATNVLVVIITSFISGLVVAMLWGMKVKAQAYFTIRRLTKQVETLTEEKSALATEVMTMKHTLKYKGNTEQGAIAQADSNKEAKTAKEQQAKA